MYTINEILQYETDDFGNLLCVFKIDEDEKGSVRVVTTSYYYDWVSQQEDYMGYYINLNEDEGEYNFNNEFNFELWREENETEEIIKDFIYENYSSIDDLPDAEEHPLA